jgi:hypothetical protein
MNKENMKGVMKPLFCLVKFNPNVVGSLRVFCHFIENQSWTFKVILTM